MKCTGKVSEFNRITGFGVISSKEAGGKVPFHVSLVVGGNGKLDAGDRVELEVDEVDGRPKARSISVVARHAALPLRAFGASV